MDIPAEVLVAAVTAAGVVAAAGIGVLGETIRRNARATREAVGHPDDNDGDLVQMVQRVIDGNGHLIARQAQQDERLARLERRQIDHAARLAELERTL